MIWPTCWPLNMWFCYSLHNRNIPVFDSPWIAPHPENCQGFPLLLSSIRLDMSPWQWGQKWRWRTGGPAVHWPENRISEIRKQIGFLTTIGVSAVIEVSKESALKNFYMKKYSCFFVLHDELKIEILRTDTRRRIGVRTILSLENWTIKMQYPNQHANRIV